jgi:hypothetical protein
MGSGANRSTRTTGDAEGLTVQQALEHVRNSEYNEVDPSVLAFLERAFVEIWRRIQAQPDSYILSRDEFACFNYFQDRHRGSEISQRAIQRYWNSRQG